MTIVLLGFMNQLITSYNEVAPSCNGLVIVIFTTTPLKYYGDSHNYGDYYGDNQVIHSSASKIQRVLCDGDMLVDILNTNGPPLSLKFLKIDVYIEII